MDVQEVVRNLRFLGADPSDIPEMLFDLSIQAYEVYKDSGRKKDIVAAIDFARGCDGQNYHDSPALPESLNYLAFLLTVRYKRLGGIENIEEAIKVARQAVHLTPQGHPELAQRITELGNGLAVRFRINGDMSDLMEAVKWAKQAVELTPADDPDRASWLNNFGNRLATVYERNSDITNLDKAIKTLRESVKLTPRGNPNMAGRMNNLANCFLLRYGTLHEVADVQEAVKAARSAVKLLPDDFTDRGIWLNNLCVSLMRIFDRRGEIEDLEDAIEAAREAVRSTAPEDANLAIFLTSLVNALQSYYECTETNLHIEEAIQLANRAIELTPKDHSHYPDRLGNLGICFSSKYEITKDKNDLEQAINFTRTSLSLISMDHPSRTGWLSNLGQCLQDRFVSQNDSTDLEEASACLEDVWHCQSAVPFRRIQAAAGCLRLLFKLGKIELAAKLGKAAIEMLPVINTNTLDLNDRQFIVKGFYSIGSDVCSSLLSLQQLGEALLYLERGRAFVISNAIDRQRDLSPLRAKSPALASRYEKLQGALYAPLERNLTPEQQHQYGERQCLLTEFNECIGEIRNLPGYERFWLGLTVPQMQDCASGGTIIIVNVTGLRSDAILISPFRITSLNLPKLLYSDALGWLRKKWTWRKSWRRFEKKNKEYCTYLSWLWDVCVDPILKELGTRDTTANHSPRVWWIGAGVASTMPFHAAGSHSINCTENTLSRAVSSYIPSIKALGFARARASSTKNTEGSMLIVTMPTTPGQITGGDSICDDLPGVLREKEEIMNVVPATLQTEILNSPSAQDVSLKLKDCRIAHFACHGSADLLDPANSRLVLQQFRDGQPEQDHLTVYAVSKLNLANGHIAYLSACSTAEIKNHKLWDEMLHTVSGFQMAGFPHVVGCLLRSNDDICVEIARSFYQSLFQQTNGETVQNEPASALHNAILAARSKYRDKPLLWAQFIHVGA